jgi:Peptidase family M48
VLHGGQGHPPIEVDSCGHTTASLVESGELCHSAVDGRCWFRQHSRGKSSRRRFEYSADREAVDFSDDPETAIRALANLHKFRELPEAHDSFTELFMTHPTFAKRVQAIANGHMPADLVADILEDSGVSVSSGLSP